MRCFKSVCGVIALTAYNRIPNKEVRHSNIGFVSGFVRSVQVPNELSVHPYDWAYRQTPVIVVAQTSAATTKH